MICSVCGQKFDAMFAAIPHYNTWPEFSSAVKQHRFDDMAAWRESHAAWYGQKQKGGPDEVGNFEHASAGSGAEVCHGVQ